MATIQGYYQGKPIYAGSDAEIMTQMNAIDAAMKAPAAPPTPVPAPVSAPPAPSPSLTGTPAPAPYVNRPPTTPPPAAPAPALPAFQAPQQQVQWLPQQPQSGTGSLTSFAAALEQATALATKNRNASSLGLMQGYQGTVAASDFNSILGNLNAASNNFSTNLVNKAMDAATPRYETQQIGNQLIQMAYDGTGRFLGASPLAVLPEQYSYDSMTLPNGDVYYIQKDSSGRPIGQQLVYSDPQTSSNTYDYKTDNQGNIIEWSYDQNGQLQTVQAIGQLPQEAQVTTLQNAVYKTRIDAPDGSVSFVAVNPDGSTTTIPLGTERTPSSSAGETKLTASERKDAEVSQYKAALIESRGSDGYVNTATYLDALDSWDGTTTDFFKYFPPALYVNPDDPTVPPYVLEAMI